MVLHHRAQRARLSPGWHSCRAAKERQLRKPLSRAARVGTIQTGALHPSFADFIRDRVQHITEVREDIAIPEAKD